MIARAPLVVPAEQERSRILLFTLAKSLRVPIGNPNFDLLAQVVQCIDDHGIDVALIVSLEDVAR